MTSRQCLALGARAVFVGRPVLWGLAYDGESGVRGVLDVLNTELRMAMALTGAHMLHAFCRSYRCRLHEHRPAAPGADPHRALLLHQGQAVTVRQRRPVSVPYAEQIRQRRISSVTPPAWLHRVRRVAGSSAALSAFQSLDSACPPRAQHRLSHCQRQQLPRLERPSSARCVARTVTRTYLV